MLYGKHGKLTSACLDAFSPRVLEIGVAGTSTLFEPGPSGSATSGFARLERTTLGAFEWRSNTGGWIGTEASAVPAGLERFHDGFRVCEEVWLEKVAPALLAYCVVTDLTRHARRHLLHGSVAAKRALNTVHDR